MMIPEDQTTFSRDLEPEYVVLNHDETKAWITLQAPPFFFFFTFVTGLKRSLSHNWSGTRVYEPEIRARLGKQPPFSSNWTPGAIQDSNSFHPTHMRVLAS